MPALLKVHWTAILLAVTAAATIQAQPIPVPDPTDRLVLRDQLAHAGRVTDLIGLPEQNLTYSTGEDGHLKVWQTEEGTQLADFDLGHGLPLSSIAVNPRNPKEVAVATQTFPVGSGEIIRFDTSRGAVIGRWPGNADALAFSADGELLAGKATSDVTVWVTRTGATLVGLQAARDSRRVQMIGQETLVFCSDNGIEFLNLLDGTRLPGIPVKNAQDFRVTEQTGRIAILSADRYTERALNSPQATVNLETPISVYRGRLAVDEQTHDAFLISSASVPLGDTRGPIFRVSGDTHTWEGLRGSDPLIQISALYAHDGSLFTGNYAGRLRHWKFDGPKLRALPELGVSRPTVTTVDVSNDSRYLIAGDTVGVVDLWDATTGVHRVFDPYNARPKLAAPRYGANKTTGVVETVVVGGRQPTPAVRYAHFLPDRDDFAVVFSNGQVRVVSATSLQVRLTDHATDDYSIFFTQTDAGMLYVGGRTAVDHWDLVKGVRLAATPKPVAVIIPYAAVIVGEDIAFSSPHGITLVNQNTHASRDLALPTTPGCLATTQSGGIVAAASNEVFASPSTDVPLRKVAAWSSSLLPATCLIRGTQFIAAVYDGRIASVPFDGGGADNTAPRIVPVQATGSGFLLFPHSQRALLGGTNGVVHLLDLASGAEVARLINWGDKGWAVVTGESDFQAPPQSWSMLVFSQVKRPLLPLDPGTGFEWLFQPSLLRDLLQGSVSPPAAAAPGMKQQNGSAPLVHILEPRPTTDTQGGLGIGGSWTVGQGPARIEISARQAGDPGELRESAAPLPVGPVLLKAEIQDTGGGVHDCRVQRNHETVKLIDSPSLTDSQGHIEASVELIAGENELEVYCFDRQGIRSALATTLVSAVGQSPAKRIAYVIGVGINGYSPSGMGLDYAVPDAQLFLDKLPPALKTTGHYDQVVPVSLLDGTATHDNIVAVLQQLAGQPDPTGSPANPLLANLKAAGPEDAVLLLFAGHGGMVDGSYQLFTQEYDEAGGKGILSDVELRKLFTAINARDFLLVLDSCEAGGVLGNVTQRIGPFDSPSFSQMAYDKGMFILLATQGQTAAHELSQLGHGLLTYVLVSEGLEERKAYADPAATELSIRDFIEYPVIAVPIWQEKKRAELLAQGKAQIDTTAKVRLITLSQGRADAVQTPRDFVPPFGYNDSFIISGQTPSSPPH